MKKLILLATATILILMVSLPVYAAGKKVLFIDSYHQGYAWSDGVQKGVEMGLDGKSIDLKIVRMDTKRNKTDEFKKAAAQKVKSEIESFNPDVVIAADDNASKFLIMPFYKDAALPFVFCGVNWDASVYGFPYSNVTGMVEVAPVNELLAQLRQYAPGNKIGYLAADVLTTHKEADNYKAILGIDTVNYYANDMQDWKKGFMELQNRVDTLIVGNTAGLPGWNEGEAEAFVVQNTKVPTGATDEHMAPFAMFGFVKIPEEQGFYAATKALEILDGKSPGDIPVVTNKDGKLYVNLKIASAAGVDVPFEILSSASKVIE
ncbi:MAG: hypothetical protein C0616_00400 [Desulfuromonas sp.]|nr:MAG: hypothetical protein C0616_00400 [Desulfuromonas sp.]